MRRRSSGDLLNTDRIFYNMIRDYANGRLDSKKIFHRARVEGVDTVGGQLESQPPNPPRSIRARVYTAGIDATTPREALTVFYPFFPPHIAPPVQQGEHVLVVFEDEQMTSGYWINIIPSYHDMNYSNPDFRTDERRDSSYVFEGDVETRSEINVDLEYGGSTLDTDGRQEMVDRTESQNQTNPWERKKVLLIGDSQAAGPFGIELGQTLRGQHRISQYIQEGRVSWGVYSWLNGRLRAGSPNKPKLEDLINQNRPDIIIISLGGNDGSSGAARNRDYEQKVRELFNTAKHGSEMVIWSGPPTAVLQGARLQAGRSIAAEKIRTVVGNSFVDVSSITNTTVGRDRLGVHFTRGAPAIEPWVNEVVQKGYRLAND